MRTIKKRQKKVNVSGWVDESLYIQIEDCAKTNQVSVSAIVNYALLEFMQAEPTKHSL